MSDYNKVIEFIRHSDIKICTLTKQIKEKETELKNVENELNIFKAKNNQITEDIKARKKELDDKNIELILLNKQSCGWCEILNEKNILFTDTKKELEEVKTTFFSSRIKFSENGVAFFNDCDFLIGRTNDIDLAINRRKEESQAQTDINVIENEISIFEQHYDELQQKLHTIQGLEKIKESLENEPDVAVEFRRIQMEIDRYERELEEITRSNADPPHKTQNFCNYIDTIESRTKSIEGVNENSSIPVEETHYFIKDNKIDSSSSSVLGFVKSSHLLNTEVKKRKAVKFHPKVPSTLAKKKYSKKTNDY